MASGGDGGGASRGGATSAGGGALAGFSGALPLSRKIRAITTASSTASPAQIHQVGGSAGACASGPADSRTRRRVGMEEILVFARLLLGRCGPVKPGARRPEFPCVGLPAGGICEEMAATPSAFGEGRRAKVGDGPVEATPLVRLDPLFRHGRPRRAHQGPGRGAPSGRTDLSGSRLA